MTATADPDEFLIAFHRAYPGCTATAFSRGRCDDGRSSYDLLADCVADRSGRVLDLACGDGYLIERILATGRAAESVVGVDMSDGELTAARARPTLEGVELICARAQDIPLDDASVGAVVSHMAFMLMSDVERVVAEIGRVLEPGGELVTVVGGGPKAGDAFELFLAEFQVLYATCTDRVGRIGDKRTSTDDGLAELFGPATGFSAPTIEDLYVHLDGTLEQVWVTLSSMYQIDLLSPEAKVELRERYETAVAPIARADGEIPCTMAIRLVRATRA
jgi:SAM-dependent methyltransferase